MTIDSTDPGTIDPEKYLDGQGTASSPRLDTAPDVDRPAIDFALILAKRNWRLIPLPPKSKAPVLPDWPNNGTSDPAQITAWFDQEPNAKVPA